MDAPGIVWRVPPASSTLPWSSALSVEASSDSLSPLDPGQDSRWQG